jgi:hypothetical protein
LKAAISYASDRRALRDYRVMPDLWDAIAAIIVRHKSCSRSMCSDIAQTHKFIANEAFVQLNLSFSVEMRPLAPAALASASISRMSAGV